MPEQFRNRAPAPESIGNKGGREITAPLLLFMCLALALVFAMPLPIMASQASPGGSASLGNWDSSIQNQIDAAENEVDSIANNPNLSKGVREVAKGLQEVVKGVRKVFDQVEAIANSGVTGTSVYGSYNQADYSSGGSNIIVNNAGVGWDIYGTYNKGRFTHGGSNTIINNDRVGWGMYGTYNEGDKSSGGSNTVVNNAGVGWSICGSYNEGDSSSGGSNTVTNTSGVGWSMYGSYNEGDSSRGSGNTIVNTRGVGWSIYGSLNEGDSSSGGSNSITNTSGIGWSTYGSYNSGAGSTGGGNAITSSRGVGWSLYGSYNDGDASSGGSNSIVNNSGVGWSLYGSLNSGDNSSGGSNTIVNNDVVGYAIIGSWNLGDNTSGGGNSILNTGTVHGSIYGSLNQGSGSTTWGNRIANAGQVDGSIFAGEGDDTVTIMAGSTVGGQVDGESGTDSLVFDTAGAVTGGQYISFEALSVVGGATDISGHLAIGGAGTVAARLLVNGTLDTTSLSITRGGLLGGSGVVASAVQNYGTIAPGNSIGTLEVQGDVAFEDGSRFAVELGANGAADRLESSGSVAINGGALSTTVVEPRLYTAPVSWEVIHADGGLTGAFTAVSLDSLTMSAAQVVLADSLQVRVWRSSSYDSLASNRVQTATARALDVLLPHADGGLADLIAHMDFTYSLAEIRHALELLSPAVYAGYIGNVRSVTRLVNEAVRERQWRARWPLTPGEGLAAGEATAHSGGWTTWARVLGQWDSHEGEDGFPGYDAGTYGLVLGVERELAAWLSMGVNAAWTDSNLFWRGSDTRGTQYGPFAGVYALASRAGFHARGSLLAGWLTNRGRREMPLADRSATASADFDTLALQARLDLGYELRGENWRVGPELSLERLHIRQPGFAESGADALNLHLASMDEALTSVALGLDAAGAWELGSLTLQAGGYLGWRHDIYDSGTDGMRMSAHFQDYPGAPIALRSPSPQQDALLTRVRLSALLAEGLSAHCDYSLEHGARETSHSLGISVGLQF